MNPGDAEHYLNEMVRIGNQNAPLARAFIAVELFIAEHWIPLTVLGLIWFALHLHATWGNLRDNRGIDRLTWLVTIWSIPLGLIFYWLLKEETCGGSALPPTNTSYTPPPTTPQSTADAVTAALAEESRKRRSAKAT